MRQLAMNPNSYFKTFVAVRAIINTVAICRIIIIAKRLIPCLAEVAEWVWLFLIQVVADNKSDQFAWYGADYIEKDCVNEAYSVVSCFRRKKTAYKAYPKIFGWFMYEYEKTKSVNIATTRSAFRTNRLLFIDRSFRVTLICNSTASICFSKNLTVLNNMHFRWRVAVWRPSFCTGAVGW